MLLQKVACILVIVLMCTTSWAGITLTIENTTEKDVFLRIISKDTEWTRRIHIEAGSARTIAIEYGKYTACAWFEGELGDCTDTEITEKNLYDEDGNKLYWEISTND